MNMSFPISGSLSVFGTYLESQNDASNNLMLGSNIKLLT